MPESTRTKTQDQLSFDEKVIDDPDLEDALEAREKLKGQRAALNAKFKEAHEAAVGLIDELAVSEDQVVRCGRFRLTKSHVDARHVEFDADASERLT
ncbi:MAG TPA: hypothetical protein VG476_14000, partial [Acidimicrobiales bacterium]|nr:hypothetical protein [Acidimicrobiales bacterium]